MSENTLSENANNESIIALLHGPDQPGLVARVANWIWERGGNILHADQHRDGEAVVFFQRVEWIPGSGSLEGESAAFEAFAQEIGMHVKTSTPNAKPKVGLFASKYGHCFHDIVLRWRSGEYPCDIACVISNHRDLEEDARHYGIPYHYFPMTKENKALVEKEEVECLRSYGVKLGILARYMQILSADFLKGFGHPVINVHHSFLPAFAGARPYQQAYERGVKLIGATAHYVTPVLDQGPIINQAVAAVHHRHTIRDLMRKGQDLEKMVLAQAVRWHLENRILTYANKTVVFD